MDICPIRQDRRLGPNRQRWLTLASKTQRQVRTELDGNMYSTGRNRRGQGPNRQRQMETQQAEADGGLHPTGRTRWEQILNRQRQQGGETNRHPTHMTYTQQVKTSTSPVETDRHPTTDTWRNQ